jgi:hypothetical protein
VIRLASEGVAMRIHRLIVGCSAALAACGPAGEAQTSDAGARADARTVDAAGSDGAGPGDPSSHSIHALAVGHSWRYHFVSAAQVDCESVVTVTGTIDIDGRHAFVSSLTSSTCGGTPIDSYSAVGADDRMEIRFANQTTWYVWDPPSEGHSWDMGTGQLWTWHATASATVPAGIFTDCWTATALPAAGGEIDATLCRGVGEVDDEGSSSMGFAYYQRLLSKNF